MELDGTPRIAVVAEAAEANAAHADGSGPFMGLNAEAAQSADLAGASVESEDEKPEDKKYAQIEDQAKSLFQEADTDGNGVLDIDEFVKLMKTLQGAATRGEQDDEDDDDDVILEGQEPPRRQYRAASIIQKWQRGREAKSLRQRSEAFFGAAPAASEAAPATEVVSAGVSRWRSLAFGFGLAFNIGKLSATSETDLTVTLEEASREFLDIYVAGLEDAVATLQAEVLAAKVPLASFGRVKSALDKLKETLTGNSKDLLQDELVKIRQSAIDCLRRQKVEIESGLHETIQKSIGDLQVEANKRVEAAVKEKRDAETEVERLRQRFADPDAAIAKIEAAFKAMDLKVKKMSATSTVAEEKIARCTESWQRGMEATLAMCTLRKDTVLMDKRTGATKVMNSMDQLKKTLAQFDPEDHGGQLEYLVKVYEDAKKAIADKNSKEEAHRKDKAHEVDDRLAIQRASMEAIEVEWKIERARLQTAVDEERMKAVAEQEKAEQLHEKLDRATKEAATLNIKSLHDEKAKIRAELVSLQREMAKIQGALEDTTSQRDAKEEENRSLRMRLEDSSASARVHLNTCMSALRQAQSAGERGGYYFAAAPIVRSVVTDAVRTIGQEYGREYIERFIPASTGRSRSNSPASQSDAARLRPYFSPGSSPPPVSPLLPMTPLSCVLPGSLSSQPSLGSTGPSPPVPTSSTRRAGSRKSHRGGKLEGHNSKSSSRASSKRTTPSSTPTASAQERRNR